MIVGLLSKTWTTTRFAALPLCTTNLKNRERFHQVQRPTGAGSCAGAGAPLWLAALPLCLTTWIVAVTAAAQATPPDRPAAAQRPNFLVILSDDLGYGDLGCYDNPVIKTPNIDRLATEGVRLTNCYAAAANCSPARTGLMTGRTPWRVGIHNWIPMHSPMHVRREEITVATLLRRAGYATCHVGKWHLNGYFNMPGQPQPSDHGFDHWFSTQNNALPNHRHPDNFVRNGRAVGRLEGFSASLVAGEAMRWLREQCARQEADRQPFFLYVCFHEPHEPIATDPKFAALYPSPGDPSRAAHHGNVTQMDEATGRLLLCVDELGLRGNTLVFFTSDNGPAITPMHPHGSAGPLRDKKGSMYEGGIRVPGILRWPGHTSPGTVSDEPVCGVDLLPTLCAAVGIEVPADRAIDGANFLPLLDGKPIDRKTPLYWQFNRARNARKSPLHDRLAEKGAYFGAYAGWEYPDWYAPEGITPQVEYGWGRQNWFEYHAGEHRAAREGVILMDYSIMCKYLVQGRDAATFMQHLCANNMDVPVGQCVYTQWLNPHGTIEADLTVTRLAEQAFLVVSADGTSRSVKTWMEKHIPEDAHVSITDMTSAYAVLNLQGPKSRQLLSRVTSVDVSNAAFPYLSMKQIDIGYAPVKAIRVTFVGELGWELYIPSEFTLNVFDTLMEAGSELGLRLAGMQALESLRIEKAYRDYGHDIDNTDTPHEVGLKFAVDFDKAGGFIGRDALLRHIESGPPKYRLTQFLLDDPEPFLYGSEPIYRDGEFVGHVLAGSYGHSLGAAVAEGHVNHPEGVTPDFIRSGSYEIDIAGERYPAKASLQPLYDPKGLRVRS